jgi:ribulose-5-phosphate 4-epimerase/fuculose-1-phosphate aldolase
VTDQEGVIHFGYALAPGDAALAPQPFAELEAWRSILRELELIGEHPDRYEGYGYGNMSLRDADGSFVITASQTSGVHGLQRDALVRITRVDFDAFHVDAVGAKPPSSESLTHAMIYAADPSVRVVFHVHCPLIWRQRSALALPGTAADVPYGTPAMAEAVCTLMAAHSQRPVLFATAGHEDGVFAAGETAGDCGVMLIACLAKARALAWETVTAS